MHPHDYAPVGAASTILHGYHPVWLACNAHNLAVATILQKKWSVDDEGEVQDLLGVEITRDDRYVTLRQTAYICKMVQNHFSEPPAQSKRNKLPCDESLPQMVADALANEDAHSAADIKAYQSIVGALLYASTNTRPDIAFAVGYLCRAMAKPTPELHDAALRVLEYLYRTREIGLRYAHRPGPVDGYSDSDWATRHSLCPGRRALGGVEGSRPGDGPAHASPGGLAADTCMMTMHM